MPRIFNKRIRRRSLRKWGWIAISMLATIGLVVGALAPALRNF